MEVLRGGRGWNDEPVLRVVVADDSEDLRLLVRTALELDGRFEVVAEAGDLTALEQALVTTDPDVAVVDLGMPGSHGPEVIERVTAVRPACAVVVLSGRPAAEMGPLAHQRGAVAYIEKVGDLADLPQRIVAALEGVGGAGTPDGRGPDRPAVTLDPGMVGVLRRIVHELRTPLTVLRAAGGVTGPAAEALAPARERALSRLERDLAALADIAGAAGGRLRTAPPERVGLAGLVSAAVEAATALVPGSTPPLTDVPDDLAVHVDRTAAEALLVELLTNALRHGTAPARVSATVADGRVVVEITDAGGWEPPHRPPPPFAGSGPGLGVGLGRAHALAGAAGWALEPRPGGWRWVLGPPVT